MIDLDDMPFEPDDAADQRVVVLEREPRKCRRHDWIRNADWNGGPGSPPIIQCVRCNAIRDEAKARRGKTSRNRGNAYEREVAAKLGGRRVGMYGDQVDVDVPGYLKVQCKNGGAYPRLIDRWLRAVPVQAGELRAVVIGDAPGAGTKRRSLICFDLDEFAMWHGGTK